MTKWLVRALVIAGLACLTIYDFRIALFFGKSLILLELWSIRDKLENTEEENKNEI